MGDRVARAGGESPAAQPSLTFLFAARAHLRSVLGPPFDQPLIGLFGLLDAPPFSLPDSAEVVGVSCAALATLRRVSGAQLEIADLSGVQGWSDPGVIFVSVKHMPDQDCDLEISIASDTDTSHASIQ